MNSQAYLLRIANENITHARHHMIIVRAVLGAVHHYEPYRLSSFPQMEPYLSPSHTICRQVMLVLNSMTCATNILHGVIFV